MTSLRSPAAQEIARKLLACGIVGVDAPASVALAVQGLCTRVSENLRRSVGDDGRNALLARALMRVQDEHPVLLDIRRVRGADIYLDGVVAGIDAHGLPAVVAAVESLLGALADVLISLIGADMVLNLLMDDSPTPRAPSAGAAP